mgnify:CR=1 FL=1
MNNEFEHTDKEHGSTTKNIITIAYKNLETSFVSFFSDNDPDIIRLKQALDQHINNQPITTCNVMSTPNGKVYDCIFKFKKWHPNVKKYENFWHHFNDFNELLYISIEYRKGYNNTCKADRVLNVFFKHPNKKLRVWGTWTWENTGFSLFSSAWSDYKRNGTMQKKWEFKSRCSDTHTTLYLLDPSKILHLHEITKSTT